MNQREGQDGDRRSRVPRGEIPAICREVSFRARVLPDGAAVKLITGGDPTRNRFANQSVRGPDRGTKKTVDFAEKRRRISRSFFKPRRLEIAISGCAGLRFLPRTDPRAPPNLTTGRPSSSLAQRLLAVRGAEPTSAGQDVRRWPDLWPVSEPQSPRRATPTWLTPSLLLCSAGAVSDGMPAVTMFGRTQVFSPSTS